MMRIEEREIERDQPKSGEPGSKIPTCKFYNKLNFLKYIVNNRVTAANLSMSESDISVSLPSGFQTYNLQQENVFFMPSSCFTFQ